MRATTVAAVRKGLRRVFPCRSLCLCNTLAGRGRHCAASTWSSSPKWPISPTPPIKRRASTAVPGRQDRQWSTPLAKQLFEAISTTGPVPLAAYMRMCLTGDLGGYYTGAIGLGRDQFGVEGDFVTSPEISQIFGELVGVWFIAEWISQGRPRQGVQLIEVGPGRGTLMDDMLRTMKRFPAMLDSLDSVFLVEASPELRDAQKRLLCGPDAQFTSGHVGTRGHEKHAGKPIVWTESIKSIPLEADKVPFIVAHEFFDALPIHAFQSAPAEPPKSTASRLPEQDRVASAPANPTSTPQPPRSEWREMMVSPVNPAAIPAAQARSKADGCSHEAPDEFQLILSSKPTRHSRYLPETSPRYRKLKQAPGSVIEICPDASLYAAEFARRIGGSALFQKPTPSGAALILDYGTSDTIPVNSLRGIRNHKLVSPFSAPGMVDLSADVDFTAVAEAATRASDGVEVHGPVSQADFLERMGVRERADVLVRAARAKNAPVDAIEKSWKRLVDRGPNGMGKTYKALAILPENNGSRRPAGFGGDVAR
ncbi:uncharacterized protein UV8b_06382 [Ustilaginoidea virens]|uniref:Protein arginine methyltransferase NDUFAF7 n=1 Tax=Ustilaginoidea virens TaxID=1159556 RepID=A0A8E5MJJ8_USTVR|nr:uncharacterized protein UV8b_06382 [Ustilaginoidea virens]QUC22141.1 hypothetical protein UV8b_06382 [Ustilaginoidea virens]